MFLVRDNIRKMKKNNKIKFPKGFLIFEMNKENRTFSVNCIQYNSDEPVTTKTFNKVIEKLKPNDATIIEFYEEDENGVEFSDLIDRVKRELMSVIDDKIIKINQNCNSTT